MVNKIAIIPARSGSKGLPNKNILMLVDKPLIAYTIEAALNANCFSKVIVSTDSLEYKEIAERYGAEVLIRSDELASDKATSYMVVEHVLCNNNDCDYFVLLQPTSPFRNSTHIKEAISLFESKYEVNFLVSVVESSKSANLVKPLDSLSKLTHFSNDFSNYRRQDSKEYSPNGAIFIGNAKEYLDKKHFFGSDSIAYIMNKADSVDIDDRLDFELAISIVMKSRKQEILEGKIRKRILDKFTTANSLMPITFIGHSIFDEWNIKELDGKNVNNFGISGINSEQYYNLILERDLIKDIGEIVFLYVGTNDIIIDGWNEEYTIHWLNKTIDKIKKLNSSVNIYLLAVPPVFGRMERNNKVIRQLNDALIKNINSISNVTWVPLPDCFYDKFGNLSAICTYDGLHFTDLAYNYLEHYLANLIK